jgi:hypothetical protein
LRRTLQKILTEYGPIAVVVYLSVFFVVLFGAWAAIHAGWKPTSVTGGVGTFTAAYLTTKVTYPVRIATTLAVTPVVARVWGRLRS